MKAIAFTFLVVSLFATTEAWSGSYSKKCSDGVCEITENGVVRYEGDPEKIAKIKAEKEQRNQAKTDQQAKYDTAPKRPANEPARVAVLLMSSSDGELAHHKDAYTGMLKDELAALGDAKIEVVPYDKVKRVLELASQPDSNSSRHSRRGKGDKQIAASPTPDLLMQVRELGIKADVLVFTHLSPKTKTGLVGGRGNGKGIAQVKNVEFSSQVSSVYKHEVHKFAQVGKSSDSFAAVGVDKKGKKGKTDMKFKRNLQKDQPALQALAKAIHKVVVEKIHGDLPSMAFLAQMDSERSPAAALATGQASKEDVAKSLKNLKGGLKGLFKK
ncbi:MAG: hypothetical protein KDD43_06675, partial [Bdellovibrionales bacterium]|nr:hypothetical protein [Bdellovibrionales bacterium]